MTRRSWAVVGFLVSSWVALGAGLQAQSGTLVRVRATTQINGTTQYTFDGTASGVGNNYHVDFEVRDSSNVVIATSQVFVTDGSTTWSHSFIGMAGGATGRAVGHDDIGILSQIFFDEERSVEYLSTSNPSPGLVEKIFYDNDIDSWWKVNNPSGPSDWFNVDFDSTAASCTVLGIHLDVWDMVGGGETLPALGLYPESTAFANTPNITSPIVANSVVVAGTDGFGDLVQYNLPAIHLGSTDVHVAGEWRQGDSAVWLGADSNGTLFNRSFASSNGYAGGASPVPLNWAVGLATDGGNSGLNRLRVNGALAATVPVGSKFALTFWGCATGKQTQLRAFGIPVLPVVFTTTGSIFLPGPRPETWELQFTGACALNFGIGIPFFCYYVNCPSGIGQSNTATLTVNDPQNVCAGCYGVQDDGVHEGFFWKIQNPSGASDWFNVNQGTASASTGAGQAGTMMTSMDIGVSEFCGVAGSFATVGEFLPNFGLDASGGTPDLNTGVSIANAPVAASQTHDGTYPATNYNLPDVAINTTSIYHAAVRWAGGDTCIWIASDTDGVDGGAQGCGNALPNNLSLLSTNSYTTAATAVNIANWALKINWN